MNRPAKSLSVVLLFLFNSLIFVACVVIIVVCISLKSLLPTNYSSSTTNSVFLLIYTSLSHIFATFLACYGLLSCRDGYLFIYISITVLLIMTHMSLSSVLFLEAPKVATPVLNVLFPRDVLNGPTAGRVELFRNVLIPYQREHRCCGIWSYRDWMIVRLQVPGTCCNRAPDDTCDELADYGSRPGCVVLFHQKFHYYMIALQNTMISLLSSQLLAVVFSFCVLYP